MRLKRSARAAGPFRYARRGMCLAPESWRTTTRIRIWRWGLTCCWRCATAAPACRESWLAAQSIHDREVEAAQLPILIAGFEVVERAAGLEGAAEAAGEHQWQARVVVLAADPHVGEKHQARVVEHRAAAFRHGVELGRKVGELAE